MTRDEKNVVLGRLMEEAKSGLPRRRTQVEIDSIVWMLDPATDPYPEFTAALNKATDEFERRALLRKNAWRLDAVSWEYNSILHGRHLVAMPVQVKYDFDKKRWRIELTVDSALGSAAFNWEGLGTPGDRTHMVTMAEGDAEAIWPKLKEISYFDVEFTLVPYRRLPFSDDWMPNDRIGLVPWAVRYCKGEPTTASQNSGCSPWMAGPVLNDILGGGASYMSDFRLAMKMDWAAPDCGSLSLCKVDGRCTFVDGVCQASDPSCRESRVCAVEGQCQAREGRCVAKEGLKCREAASHCKNTCSTTQGKHVCGELMCGINQGRCVDGNYNSKLGWLQGE